MSYCVDVTGLPVTIPASSTVQVTWPVVSAGGQTDMTVSLWIEIPDVHELWVLVVPPWSTGTPDKQSLFFTNVHGANVGAGSDARVLFYDGAPGDPLDGFVPGATGNYPPDESFAGKFDGSHPRVGDWKIEVRNLGGTDAVLRAATLCFDADLPVVEPVLYAAGGVIDLAGAGGSGATGPEGPAGATGATGPAGATGPGVAAGGSTGQVLTKTSGVDYATNWQTPTTGGAPTGTAGGALDGSYPNPGLAASVAGNGLTETADVLSVNVDGTTLAIASDALKVNTDGNAAHYLSGAGTWTTPAGATTNPRLLTQEYGPMPVAVGARGMYRIPYINGTAVTFTLARATLHLETAGSTTSTLIVEKSTASGGFVGSTVATLTLAAAATDVTVTAGLGTLVSGTLVRFRWTALGTGAQSFHAQLEGAS